MRVAVVGGFAAMTLGALVACGSSTPAKDASVGGGTAPSKWPTDDRSLCEWRGKPELEVSETAGPGAMRPNVRRVYKDIGEGDSRHNVLICREIDTNLDGLKDVVRTFNAKGEAQAEKADTNYDGKLDVWMTFVAGRMSEEDVDTNRDGVADIWKIYADGKLSRVRRDRNFDGKPDVWEIYTNGHLERMGIDDNFDGHVDRWDRDESVRDQASSGTSSGGASSAAAGADAGAAASPASSDGGAAASTGSADTAGAASDAGK
jgi:hypothetical protein